MTGQIVTLGKKPEPDLTKPENEIIDVQKGSSYIIKTAGGKTLVINGGTIIMGKPEVGKLVMDYCKECKSYEYSDLFSTRCNYNTSYVCTPGTMVYFCDKPKANNLEKKKEIVFDTADKDRKTLFFKLKKLLHMR